MKFVSPYKADPNELNEILSYASVGDQEAKEQGHVLNQCYSLICDAEVASHQILNMINQLQSGKITMVELCRSMMANGLMLGIQHHNFFLDGKYQSAKIAVMLAEKEAGKNEGAEGNDSTENRGTEASGKTR